MQGGITVAHSNAENNTAPQAPYGSNNPMETHVSIEQGASSVMQSTTFVDDGAMVSHDTSHFVRLKELFFRNSDNMPSEQGVIDFLKKPIVLVSGNFATTDTFSFLNYYSMPYAALTSTQGILWLQKLAGYFGIRMTMRFRLVVNANKFQQGRYCMGWIPFCGATYDSIKNTNTANLHMNTLVQRTTVQHVELDLNTDTSAELVVPFVSVRNFYPLNEAIAAAQTTVLGYLSVYPYSVLTAVSGSTTASYTIYVSFEDVELIGAASAQSGLPDKELSNKLNGPLSAPLSAVSRGFKEFEAIPLLSSYATSVSWIADRLARSAAIFGFSKPTQGDSMIKQVPLSAPNHSTVDGDSDARSIGLLSKPGVSQVVGLAGTDLDEMDFSFIARKYAWFQTVSWASTGVVGNLNTIQVSNTYSFVSGAFSHYTPISFVSNFFLYWRGSIKFKFKFVRTQFHSGRLSFAFYPTDQAASLTAGPQYVHRWIVDIRDNNEVEIVVPYISNTQYTDIGTPIGNLVIDIVDPLVAPGTVASSISILCEVAAGDDFELAVPSSFDYAPAIVAPQSGMDNAYNIMSGTIGASSIVADPNVASSTSIGEKVSSFRPLLRRYTRFRPNTGADTSTFLLNTPGIAFIPDFIPILASTPGTDYWQPDLLAVVASCYGMWRGGIRVRDVVSRGMMSTTSLSPLTVVYSASDAAAAQNVPVATSGATAAFTSRAYGVSHIIQEPDKNAIATVEIPQYVQAYGRCIADLWADNSGTNKYIGTSPATNGGFLFINAPLASVGAGVTKKAGYTLHNLFRAMADDGSLHCFISVPPMRNVGTNLANWGIGFY